MIDTALEKGEISGEYPREFVLGVLGFLFRSYDEIFPLTEHSEPGMLMIDMKNFVTFLQFGLAAAAAAHS